jgi:hypothetical protein
MGSTVTVPASTTLVQLPAGIPDVTQAAKALWSVAETAGLGLGGMGDVVLAMRTTARCPLLCEG